MINNDINSLLIIYNEIVNNGFDGQNFINGLSEHFRKLLLSKNEKTASIFSINQSLKQKYLSQSQQIEISFLIEALKLSNECDLKYKLSSNKRLLVEVCLMQISSINFTEPDKKKK